MIAIIDYGVGNLFSLSSSLSYLGLENKVTNSREVIGAADRIILPGVGAFGDAAQKLQNTGLVEFIKEETADGKPLLGICLGMQLLFTKGWEYGEHQGLDLIPGEICPLKPDLQDTDVMLKVPHIGWNSLGFTPLAKSHPLLKYNRDGDYMYYVHSFYAKYCTDSTLGLSEYGLLIPGLVAHRNVMGAQFHPEKSGKAGLAMLKAFSEL